MKTIILTLNNFAKQLDNIALLLVRFVLAYGFYKPAMMKWKDISGIGSWFESMGYPFPLLNAYLAGITEVLGVILLAFGLGTRIISVPLLIVMIVAILTVHFANGFEAGNNGFEIPLYYIIMLFVLIAFGPGKFSFDNFLKKNSAN
ncbi:MAG: DoxX family protein [Mariniphaga sp.]|nr:DoxX family protein [Mariniphaga sp.]